MNSFSSKITKTGTNSFFEGTYQALFLTLTPNNTDKLISPYQHHNNFKEIIE